jgi:hypothetical protein
VLLFILSANICFSQADANKKVKVKIKGMYIYQFAKNIYWPQEYSNGDFMIGVYGDEDIYNQLSISYTDKLIGNQKIKVKFFSNQNDIQECHLLYISQDKNSSLTQVKKLISEQTLLVSEGQNLVSTGSIINFIYVQSNLKFQVNKTKAEKNDLKIGQTLTKLAETII